MSENIDESGGSLPFGDDAQEEAVRQIGRTDKDGASVGHFTLTPASDTRPKELLCDVRPIIPVIFLPGVMGSPLVHATNGDDVFFPPNTDGLLGKAGALPALIGMWFRGGVKPGNPVRPDHDHGDTVWPGSRWQAPEGR